jgi:periplasmic divalent cation tolerance protein
MQKPIMIVSTYPDKKSISKIANKLVKEKLVACVNTTKISSVYSWQGKIENADEFLAIFKTTQKNKIKVKNQIKTTHPYKVPEIAEIQVNSINKPYLDWLIESTL